MNKFRLMLALLAAPSMVLASCGDDPGVVDDKISSVKVSLAKTTIYEGETTKATANVTAKDGVDSSVTWSSSNTAVATVDAQGNVTAHKKGTAKIIATSNYDKTKKGEKTLTVKVDQGFDPSWIEEGFTYSKEFPTSKIKEFLGSGEYDVPVPSEMLEGGAYYLESPESADSAACFVVIIDGVLNESYAYDLLDAGFERVYGTSLGTIEGVDPTGTYTVSIYCYPDETTYEDAAPTFIQFYKSEDVWDSPNKTSDTAWNLERIVNVDPSEIAIATEWVGKVPFVALGEDYSIEYIADDSEYYYYIDVLMMFGFTEEEAIEYMSENGLTKEALTYYYLSVYDYSLCEPFEGYEDVLINAGYVFVSEEDEYGDVYEYYELSDGLFAYDLSFGFAETGNTIYLEQTAAVLDAFPKSYVDEFVASGIGSKYEVPAYAETTGAKFQAYPSADEFDVVIDSAKISEFEAYKDKLIEAGFEVEYTPASENDYPGIYATKGKIVVEMELVQEEGDEDYLDYSPVYMYIYGDDSKHEEKGVYLPETTNSNVKLGSIELDPEIVDLDGANFTWASSDTEIATVEDGVVTMLQTGEVDITVTSDVEIPEVGGFYSATTHLVIAAKPDFAPVLAELNEALEYYGGTEVLTAEDLPEIDCAKYETGDLFYDYGCFAIWGDMTEETEESYATKVEGLGFEVLEDEYGKFYQTEEYDIYFSYIEDEEEGDYFQICVYFQEEASEGATFDFSEISETSGSMNGFSFTTSKAGGQSAPAYNGNKLELRLYANNTITFTSEEPMTEIFFDANTCGESKATGTFVSASTGSVSKVDGGFLWEGNATEVTLTVSGSGQIHINLIDINGGGSGGGGGGGQSGDIEDLCDEVSLLLFGEEGGFDYDSESEVYYTYVEPESSSLLDACSEVADILADVYFELQAPAEDEDEDGPYALAAYTDDNWEYIIQVVSFEDEGETWVEVDIYAWED